MRRASISCSFSQLALFTPQPGERFVDFRFEYGSQIALEVPYDQTPVARVRPTLAARGRRRPSSRSRRISSARRFAG
jgi:hypothetical protein